MNGPTIVVTGASRGLGAAAARIAAQMGANVVLAARSLGALEEEAQKIVAAGGSALVVQADASREAGCQRIIQRALDQFGRIDALVNNAGMIEPMAPIAEADWQAWEQNWRLNVLGPVMLTRLALPALRERNGRVINVSSGAAVNVIGGWGAYSTAKVAINHLTRILASEEPAVTAIALRPGIVDTEMQATIREKGRNRMAERNYNLLYGLYEQGRLLPPDAPGRALACLALHAPREWSGETIQWDEERVQQLVQAVSPHAD